MKKSIAMVLLAMSLAGCISGITHPTVGLRFKPQTPLFRPILPGSGQGETTTEHFGVIPVFMRVERRENGFYYSVGMSFLVDKKYDTVTIHEVVMLANGKEQKISGDNPEVFLMQPRWAFSTVTDDGKWYAGLRYSSDEQKARLTGNGKRAWYITVVPAIDLLKVVRKLGFFITRAKGFIGVSNPAVTIRISYQIDGGELLSAINSFDLVAGAGYSPGEYGF
jgi:hypothetical protein